MLLEKYLKTINSINPGKIYIENVRAFFHVPRSVAKLMCEMAVVDKLFERKIGLVCPGCHRILASFSTELEIPEIISCDICEAEDKDVFEHRTSELDRVTFYKLSK